MRSSFHLAINLAQLECKKTYFHEYCSRKKNFFRKKTKIKVTIIIYFWLTLFFKEHGTQFMRIFDYA